MLDYRTIMEQKEQAEKKAREEERLADRQLQMEELERKHKLDDELRQYRRHEERRGRITLLLLLLTFLLSLFSVIWQIPLH